MAVIDQVWQILPFILIMGIGGMVGCWMAFKGREQRSAFLQAFCAGLLATALSRTAAVFFDDQLQNSSDAFSFFETSAIIMRETDVFEVRTLINGWGSVWLWSQFYSAMGFIMPQPTPLVGITFNVLAYAIAGAILVDVAEALKRVLSINVRQLKRYVILPGALFSGFSPQFTCETECVSF